VTLVASTRMTAQLNSVINQRQRAAAACAAVINDDVAHHVVDSHGLLGLDPVRATELAEAWPAVAAAEPEQWVLALPLPGRLGVLRGPAALNAAALEAGSAVVAGTAGLALVPHPVGRAVQWVVLPAERPFRPPSPHEAERALSEAVISAAAALSRLDVAAGQRPDDDHGFRLAPGYDSRQRAAADRAGRLLVATDLAAADDGGSLSSYEALARSRELRAVRDAAREALSAAASWLHR
jgi:hypothetical protein